MFFGEAPDKAPVFYSDCQRKPEDACRGENEGFFRLMQVRVHHMDKAAPPVEKENGYSLGRLLSCAFIACLFFAYPI